MQVARLAGIPNEIINVAEQAGMKLEEKLQVHIFALLSFASKQLSSIVLVFLYTDLSIAIESFSSSHPAGRL